MMHANGRPVNLEPRPARRPRPKAARTTPPPRAEPDRVIPVPAACPRCGACRFASLDGDGVELNCPDCVGYELGDQRAGRAPGGGALGELLVWWAAAAGRLDRLQEDVEYVLRAARRAGSPLADAFRHCDLEFLMRELRDTANAMHACFPILPPPDDLGGILDRLGV